ncbi:DUF2087 domain-containing protein [Phaeovulum sp.]|uniref:DUF2087 domain-containing protein n=1 Tax=Phaeovulum sp. TaxID=2934796 RepID=UPI0035652668
MTRTAYPFEVADISALAKALVRQLSESAEPPGHLTMLNMLARGAGWRNYQHFRASQSAEASLATPAESDAADFTQVERALRQFDPAGRLIRWPSRTSQVALCLWPLWAKLPAEISMTEREVSERLNAWHLFGDAAQVRRTMVGEKMLTRKPDCTDYRRVEQRPPPEALALIRALSARA